MVDIQKIEKLEDELLTLPKLELAVSHHFTDGVYVRCLYFPAGTMATGRIHKTEHIAVCTKGKGILVTQNGRFEFAAGTVITVPADTKKAFYAEEDSIIMNIFKNDDNMDNIEAIEEKLTHPVDYRHSLLEKDEEWLLQ